MNAMIDILVIEDDEQVRRQIAAHLAQGKFIVREADTMSRALLLIMERQPDVALLDINLPDASGPDSVAILHRFCREVAIVAFTGDTDLSIAVDCVRNGALDFISKAGRTSFLDDVASRVRLANYSGGRLERTVPTDLHDSIQIRIDKLLQKIPDSAKNPAVKKAGGGQ